MGWEKGDGKGIFQPPLISSLRVFFRFRKHMHWVLEFLQSTDYLEYRGHWGMNGIGLHNQLMANTSNV